ncbi:hypothetical protein SAMN03159330_4087 [Klebsiella quasipneumoniae]|nr:hypothetical protein SAMN03159330_4087 [Klebsiella quasipneumoniae]
MPCGCLCYLWLQRSLRSRLVFCVMSLMAQGAHRGRPVAAAPCTPGLRPAKSPLRGPFDLSLQASGRAEAASVQNTALSPHPCGLPRPSGNVSAILRPPVPAVSATMVNKLTTGRKNVGRVRRSRHPAKKRRNRVAWEEINARPAAQLLAGPTVSAGRVVRVRRSRHPATSRVPRLASRPAALRLRGPTGCEPVRGSSRPGKAQPPPGTKAR